MCPAMRSKTAKRLRRTKQSNRAVRKANSSGVSWGNPSENYEKMQAGSFSRQPSAISLLGKATKPEQNYQQLLNGSFSGSGTKGDGSLASATLGPPLPTAIRCSSAILCVYCIHWLSASANVHRTSVPIYHSHYFWHKP